MKTVFLSLLIAHFFDAILVAEELTKRTQVLMGTYVSVSLKNKDLALSQKVFERLKKVENALSSYDPQAEIYQLNDQHESNLSKDTYDALILSKKYYENTQGYFDITIGSITKGLFHFGEAEALPSKDALSKAKIDFNGLHFDRTKAWTDEGVKIDLGGMGKGFGVDKAKEVLIKQGVKEGVIALSGDIFCFHRCQMAIQNPFSEDTLASFVMAEEMSAISTSGNYRRYVKNIKYNHLINPKTRQSQRAFASITLISTEYCNSDLDAYATAASVMPELEALSFLDSLGLAYLLVTNDKRVVENEELGRLTQKLDIHYFENSPQREYIRVSPSKTQNSKKRSP